MGRPPEIPGKPKTERLVVKMTPEGIAYIDKMRGKLSRPAFMRKMLAEHERRGTRG